MDPSFLGGIWLRWVASRHVAPYMLAIAAAYFVTLCLFPGIETEVVSCRLHSWMPVILIALMNLFDLIGKVGSLCFILNTDGLVQDKSNSSALAMSHRYVLIQTPSPIWEPSLYPSQFSLFWLVSCSSWISKHCLPMTHHFHIWQK